MIAEYTSASWGGAYTWAKSYVYAGSRLLSTFANSGAGGEVLEFHHPDRLGTRMVTNPSADTLYLQSTLPFGTLLSSETTGSSNRLFTSYDRSSSTGLDYAVNRTYSSGQGRFTQPDPIGMASVAIGNPRSFNLYAYVQNNPIDFVDPSGLCPEGTVPMLDDLGVMQCVGVGGHNVEVRADDGEVTIGTGTISGGEFVIEIQEGNEDPTDGGGGEVTLSELDVADSIDTPYHPRGNVELKQCLKKVVERSRRDLEAITPVSLFNLTLDDLLSAGPGAIVCTIVGGITGGIPGAIGGFILGYVASLIGTWGWRILAQFIVNVPARAAITAKLVIGTLDCYAAFGHNGF